MSARAKAIEERRIAYCAERGIPHLIVKLGSSMEIEAVIRYYLMSLRMEEK
jgi:hypothetical protein